MLSASYDIDFYLFLATRLLVEGATPSSSPSSPIMRLDWPTLLLDNPPSAPDSDAAIADWLALAGDRDGEVSEANGSTFVGD